jgi:hypothetical protein
MLFSREFAPAIPVIFQAPLAWKILLLEAALLVRLSAILNLENLPECWLLCNYYSHNVLYPSG